MLLENVNSEERLVGVMDVASHHCHGTLEHDRIQDVGHDRDNVHCPVEDVVHDDATKSVANADAFVVHSLEDAFPLVQTLGDLVAKLESFFFLIIKMFMNSWKPEKGEERESSHRCLGFFDVILDQSESLDKVLAFNSELFEFRLLQKHLDFERVHFADELHREVQLRLLRQLLHGVLLFELGGARMAWKRSDPRQSRDVATMFQKSGGAVAPEITRNI